MKKPISQDLIESGSISYKSRIFFKGNNARYNLTPLNDPLYIYQFKEYLIFFEFTMNLIGQFNDLSATVWRGSSHHSELPQLLYLFSENIRKI